MVNGRQRQIRTYERYCAGAVWTGLLAFAAVGVFVALLFLPIFVYAGNGAEPVYINGVEFIIYSFRESIFSQVYPLNPKLADFDLIISAYNQPNAFYKFIGDYHSILEMVLAGIFTLSIVFVLIVGILGFVFLVSGRNHSPIMTSAMTSSALFFLTIFLSLGFLYFFLCHNMIIEIGGSQWVMFHYAPLILLGSLVVIVVALNIVYSTSFKGRRFAGSVTNTPNNNNRPPHLNSAYNQPDYSNLPTGLQEIGPEAFAMNTNLRRAQIPEGIYSLGAGAFSNCLNLEVVMIPLSVMEIGPNCFFNTPNLRQIIYQGSMEQWEMIYKGENWITMSGVATIDTNNGQIPVGGYCPQNQQ